MANVEWLFRNVVEPLQLQFWLLNQAFISTVFNNNNILMNTERRIQSWEEVRASALIEPTRLLLGHPNTYQPAAIAHFVNAFYRPILDLFYLYWIAVTVIIAGAKLISFSLNLYVSGLFMPANMTPSVQTFATEIPPKTSDIFADLL